MTDVVVVNYTTMPTVLVDVPGAPGVVVPTVDINASGIAEQIEPYTLHYPGLLQPFIGINGLPLEGPYSLSSVRFSVASESTSGDVTLDLKCNGVSIFAAPVHIVQGARTLLATSLATKTVFAKGDILTVDIVSPGLSLTSADLTVILRLKRLF
jgi:hypothetical protein